MGKVICHQLCEGSDGFNLKGLIMAFIIALAIMATCFPSSRRRFVIRPIMYVA
uniref:Uncharacterized protein n=1 Tax=Manihot esculenta TaxID=3983 RepID=A0A2C9VW51_MANES